MIGSPLEPVEDQLLEEPFTVEPYLILLPNLPSYITSPSNAVKGWILSIIGNVFPKSILWVVLVTIKLLPNQPLGMFFVLKEMKWC